MNLVLEFRLTEIGWAEVSLQSGDSSCVVTASYLSDAYGDLILSAVAVMSLFRRVTFSFEEEPGEYRWVVSSPRTNEIELQILSFPNRWSDAPDEAGTPVFKTRCLPATYAKAVFDAGAKLLATHGEAGYLERWDRYPFPMERYRDLERLLKREQGDGVA